MFILVAERLECEMSVCVCVCACRCGLHVNMFLWAIDLFANTRVDYCYMTDARFFFVLSANVFFITLALVYDIDSLTRRGQCKRTRYRPSHVS